MGYRGYYINLDRSVSRRQHIETQLAHYNLDNQYERFAGADGNVLGVQSNRLNDAEIGCFTSHYLLLKKNVDAGQHLHIVEDDVVFCRDTEWAVNLIVQSEDLAGYDIIFTDTSIPLEKFKNLKDDYDNLIPHYTRNNFSFCIIDYIACTSSYIIKPSSIRRVSDILEAALQRGTESNIDIVIREKSREGQLRVGCVFPFVTSVLIGDTPESVRREGRDQSTALAYDLARASFFIGRDLDKLSEHSERLSSALERDTHADLLARILRFALSRKWRRF